MSDHLVFATDGHLIHKVASGHLVYGAAAGVPSSCPWPGGGLASPYTVSWSGYVQTSSLGVIFNDPPWSVPHSAGCAWYTRIGNAEILFDLNLYGAPYWEMFFARAPISGSAWPYVIVAQKTTGSTPVGLYTVTYRRSEDVNTIDGIVIS